MKTLGLFAGGMLVVGLVAPAMVTKAPATEDGFTLAGAIPNDVFLYVAGRENPERDFLDQYWGEVFDALGQSGVGGDLMGMLGSLLGTEQMAEVQRLKDRASQLVKGVDWDQLAGKEMVFAEQFVVPARISDQNPPIMMPNMIWLFRGSGEGAAENYEGLVVILEALAEEINKALGYDALAVERTTRMGAKVAGLNMLAMVRGAPALPISVALRDDVVIIALREHLLADVLGMMSESSPKKALGDDPRFKAAFAKLPSPEDAMTFFDMQALLKPIRALVDDVIDLALAPSDVYDHSGMTAEVNMINARALAAYQSGDVKQALTLTHEAHAADPENSIVLYNLACFSALVGDKDEALDWLGKAIEGGFYAPKKIAEDSDLESLRGEPKYQAALARAAELARGRRGGDIVINSTKTGEHYRLLMQAWQVYQEKEYEQGLKLVEQAYAVAPKDSRVLYGLACFHALLGHQDKALDYLAEAVDGGFYCPGHMSTDPDLETLRGDERYQTALATAQRMATGMVARQEADKLTLGRQLVDRVTDAVGILDYAATVETTDGYAARVESIVALVPNAKDRPIYPVFGKRRALTDFDRYLPQETMSFSVSDCLDLGELYKFLEDSFRLGGPMGEDLLAKWAGIQKQLGIDVQKDIIGWIDTECISVTLADGGGSVWLIGVRDEQTAREKVGAAITFLSTKLSEAAAKNPALAGLAMLGIRTSPVVHEQLEGFEHIHFTMSPQPAVWGVANGYLIFGSSADAVALCLATAKGEHPNIRSNARVMSEAIVPTGPFASVTLTDQRGLGEELATGIGIASMVTGMMGTFIPEPEVRPVIAKIAGILAKLTPVVRKIDFYKSAASHTTFDGQAWHSRSVTHYSSPAERAAKGKD